MKPLHYIAGTLGVVGVVTFIVWEVRDADREATEHAVRSTIGWQEEHEPCRDEATLLGPSAGQPDRAKCRKDQRAEAHDAGDGALIVCRCER